MKKSGMRIQNTVRKMKKVGMKIQKFGQINEKKPLGSGSDAWRGTFSGMIRKSGRYKWSNKKSYIVAGTRTQNYRS